MTHPAPCPPAQADGWIDPQGRYYACGWAQHAAFAEELGKTVYGLEDDGWLHISGGVVVNEEHQPTQSQMDTVFDLIQVDPTTTFAAALRGYLTIVTQQ